MQELNSQNASDVRLERPGSEETEVGKMLRYEGTTTATELLNRFENLGWMH